MTEDFMSEQHHEEAHTGPIKKPKQLLLAVFYSFVVPVFIIIGLVKFVTSSETTGPGAANAEMSKAVRQVPGLCSLGPSHQARSGDTGSLGSGRQGCHGSPGWR